MTDDALSSAEEAALTGSEWVPAACTLPTADQPLRLAEFDDLFARTLTHVDRIGPRRLRLVLSGAGDLAAAVSDLAARESACCSFFTFTTTAATGAGEVILDVEVPEAYVDVLDALAERARHTRNVP